MEDILSSLDHGEELELISDEETEDQNSPQGETQESKPNLGFNEMLEDLIEPNSEVEIDDEDVLEETEESDEDEEDDSTEEVEEEDSTEDSDDDDDSEDVTDEEVARIAWLTEQTGFDIDEEDVEQFGDDLQAILTHNLTPGHSEQCPTPKPDQKLAPGRKFSGEPLIPAYTYP